MLNGTYLKKETQDVKEFFKTDPKLARVPLSLPKVVEKPSQTQRPVGSVPKAPPAGGVQAAEDLRRGATVMPESKRTPNPPTGGPTAEDLRTEILKQNQTNKWLRHAELQQAALLSARGRHTAENTWNAFGYQGRKHKLINKHKKNSVVPN